jgi:uncharacterized membrane protein YtjA (UPF0391 family)
VAPARSLSILTRKGVLSMSLLKFALLFLVLAGIAALFGFSGIAQGSADIAKMLILVFLVIFAIIGVLSVTVFKTVT